MSKNKDENTEEYKQGTFIDGIAASEVLDSSGERIEIKGVDISSLVKGTGGLFNFEHQSKDTQHMIGKILVAKKILKESDCENERQKYYWNKVKVPYIYTAGELFDGAGHSSAQDVAAMLRYDVHLDKRKAKQLVHFSIEGSTLEKQGSLIKKCIARKVTITLTPCNHTCIVEKLKKPASVTKTKKSVIDNILGKSEENTVEIMKAGKYANLYTPSLKVKLKPKEESPKAKYKPITTATGENREGALIKPKRVFKPNESPSKMKVGDRISYNKPKTISARDAWDKQDKESKLDKSKKNKKYMSNMRKALMAGSGMGSPSTKTGMAALSREEVSKVNHKISGENWKTFSKAEELTAFLEEKLPNLNKHQILALAKTVAYLRNKKEEAKLKELLDV